MAQECHSYGTTVPYAGVRGPFSMRCSERTAVADDGSPPKWAFCTLLNRSRKQAEPDFANRGSRC